MFEVWSSEWFPRLVQTLLHLNLPSATDTVCVNRTEAYEDRTTNLHVSPSSGRRR